MSFQQLEITTVPKYLESLENIRDIFSDFRNLQIEEIGDGNLNFVYRVTDKDRPEETVIIKQAVPYVRLVGESWPLTRDRIHAEYIALQVQKKLCPEHVPSVLHYSKEMSVIVMQNLDRHAILRGEIISGKRFPKLAEHISTFLAKTLFFTSDLYLDHKTKKESVRDSINIELCKITEDLVFTDPYEDSESNEYNPKLTSADLAKVQENGPLKLAVMEMKYQFMNHAEARIHGDLHIGSIMINEEETYVIDPEFSFYGPMGFDIGAFIGNLLMSYFSHDYRQKLLGNARPSEYRQWLLDVIVETWLKFRHKFDHYWQEHHTNSGLLTWNYADGTEDFAALREAFLDRIFSDSIGFAACKMMRRVLGLAKVADIAAIEDLEERLKIERMTLDMASNMIIHRHQIRNIESLVKVAIEISPLT